MITVQKARSSFADEIAAFQIAMALETEKMELDPETVRMGVEAVFADSEKGQYYVAIIDRKPVASLMITREWSDWRNGNIYWIQSVYVRPEFRGTGVFTRMYQHIKDRVQNDPALSGIRLYVDMTNRKARRLYKKLGMDGSHYQLFEWMK